MQSVLITGGSSGIGEALAREAARQGARAIFLCGRNAERLAGVAAACRALGCAHVRADAVDVTDADAVAAWMRACDAEEPLDAVFANAGVGTGVESASNVRNTFAINVNGTLNTVLEAVALFRARKRAGHVYAAPPTIALTASIAGYAPLSTCPAYAGTKACVKNWGLSLRGHLRREGIRVCVVCPGFIRSRLTDRNTCPMPFFMEAPKAARIIWRRVARNVGLVAFPFPMRFATWLLALCPWRLAEWIAGLLPAKNAEDARGITL